MTTNGSTVNPSHVAGGAVGALLGAVVAGLLRHYTSVHPSDVDAAAIGSAAVAAGVWAGHILGTVGLIPAFHRLLHGPPSQATPVSPQVS